MNICEANNRILKELRSPSSGVAIVTICRDNSQVNLIQGDDPLSESTLFQYGSITKTLTSLLLADCVAQKLTSLELTLGEILGPQSGWARNVSLLSLATHSSGLPRLPANLQSDELKNEDPYAKYNRSRLLDALQIGPEPAPGKFNYSNFGYMVLALALEAITNTCFRELSKKLVFDRLGMDSSFIGMPTTNERIPAYGGFQKVPWWYEVPGPSGMTGSIRDLELYLRGMIVPPVELAEAVALTLTEYKVNQAIVGLGWLKRDEIWWHNGSTGGFYSLAAFHQRSRCAVGMLSNTRHAEHFDEIGFEALSQMISAS